MSKNGKSEWFERAMGNGLIATFAWFLLLLLYVAFRSLRIEAPGLDLAFQLLTGGWVAMLTLAQSRKNQKTEEDVKTLKETVETEVKRADASELRESEWSQHKDHSHEVGDDAS